MFPQFVQYQNFYSNISYKLPDIIPSLAHELSPPARPRAPKVKKDPILDTPDEIKKWLLERRKRFPNPERKEPLDKPKDLSILEQRLRKKISILSGSSRRTQIKVQQIKELCRTITEGQKFKHKPLEAIDPQASSDSEQTPCPPSDE